MNVIELSDVTKTFGSLIAVDCLSLDVPRGCVYGFIGPNGSGKTTTLRMVMNIYYPDSGTVRVLGQPPGSGVSDRIGYLPEDRGLYRKMRVRELLLFYGGLKNGKNLGAEVDSWLERLGLSDCADRKVEALSKGMRQKVQFLATVVSRPDLLILDEPFSGLDPVNTDLLKGILLELKAQGITTIFSTHDMNVAEQMCDFICMIFRGRKVLDGTLASIQNSYAADTIRLKLDGESAHLQEIPGVAKLIDFGGSQEIRMLPGADPQLILSEAAKRGRITRWEVVHPSLHDVFVRIAGPLSQEVVNDQDSQDH